MLYIYCALRVSRSLSSVYVYVYVCVCRCVPNYAI